MLKFRIPLLLLAVSLLSHASPIAYNINFTGGSTAMLGSFTYDAAVPSFSNFQVVWDAITFDLTSAANSGPNSGSCISSAGAAGSFQILSGQVMPGCGTGWTATSDGTSAAFGFYASGSDFSFFLQSIPASGSKPLIETDLDNFTIAAVPEPTTAGVTLFVLAGLGIAARRRLLR